MAIRTEALPHTEPTSLTSGVLARSLWWLVGGASLQRRGRSDLDGLNPGASVATPEQIRSLEQVRDVMSGLVALTMPIRQDDELRYRWIDTALQALQYRRLARGDRGLVLNYLQRLTGYSRAQVNRLVARWMAGQALTKQYARPEHAFARRYQATDIALLAEVDGALGRLSGAATTSVLRRQRDQFGDQRLASLASISVSQLYLLRRSAEYLAVACTTADLVPPRQLTVGARRARPTELRPGQLRVESVHDGRSPASWAVCLVDIASHWRVLIEWPSCAGDGIARPPAAANLAAFVTLSRQLPFAPLEVAAAEGSDERCRQVAAGIESVRAEARVPAADFELDPWACFVNLHRPSASSDAHDRDPGAVCGHRVLTPLDRLTGLADAASWLRPGLSLARLLAQAQAMDTLRAAVSARAYSSARAGSPKAASRPEPSAV